ncbi:hypothetical protein [Oceanirhabdus seepicola]|uniref:Uncharacterized protein n=1 Tax=Oceanirhabdus seepicola TaxID=2828781 RepID=A0A9J6NWH5_9CLOT|nr:hypothetical protein [Oceanirhabdus seepicola]MCM1988273.1 hypothetical protein [Oceanirhabdus seepicola]
MNVWALLGILALLYAVMVFVIAAKKPEKIWNMKKIEGFKKVLGEKGTVIFFYIWGAAFVVLGVWLLMK